MSVLLSLVTFAQQSLKVPDHLHVQVDGGGGLGWKDLLVPAIAFLGVMYANRYNRTTLERLEARRDEAEDRRERAREARDRRLERARDYREDKRIQEAAAREDQRESDRTAREAQRDLHTDRREARHAFAVLRTAVSRLITKREYLYFILRDQKIWAEWMVLDLGFQTEDEVALGLRMEPELYGLFQDLAGTLRHLDAARTANYSRHRHEYVEWVHGRVSRLLPDLMREVDRLQVEAGQPVAAPWRPLKEHEWEPYKGAEQKPKRAPKQKLELPAEASPSPPPPAPSPRH